MTVEREPDPYWNDDQPLGEVAVGRQLWLARVRSHFAVETYQGRGSETLFALREPRGQRTYVQSRLYLEAPPGSRREEWLADGQAWFYPTERALVLWELLLDLRVAGPSDPRENLLLRTLWLRFEHFLRGRFPGADHCLTTWEDTYARAEWARFLRTIGYRQTAPAVFAKPFRRPTP